MRSPCARTDLLSRTICTKTVVCVQRFPQWVSAFVFASAESNLWQGFCAGLDRPACYTKGGWACAAPRSGYARLFGSGLFGFGLFGSGLFGSGLFGSGLLGSGFFGRAVGARFGSGWEIGRAHV